MGGASKVTVTAAYQLLDSGNEFVTVQPAGFISVQNLEVKRSSTVQLCHVVTAVLFKAIKGIVCQCVRCISQKHALSEHTQDQRMREVWRKRIHGALKLKGAPDHPCGHSLPLNKWDHLAGWKGTTKLQHISMQGLKISTEEVPNQT
jgi:hypothetical protein